MSMAIVAPDRYVNSMNQAVAELDRLRGDYGHVFNGGKLTHICGELRMGLNVVNVRFLRGTLTKADLVDLTRTAGRLEETVRLAQLREIYARVTVCVRLIMQLVLLMFNLTRGCTSTTSYV